MKKILLIDNDPVILKLAQQIFDSDDYDLITTEGGLEALEILEREKYDLVILDLIMSNLSGQMICEVIRNKKELSHIPIIILSAVLAEEQSFESLGADAFVAKGPFKEMKENLLKTARELLSDGYVRKSSSYGRKILGIENLSRRQVVKELLETNNRLIKVISHISEGLVETDNQFRVLCANETASKIIGESRLSLIGRNFLEVLQIQDDPNVRCGLEDTVCGKKPFHEFQRLLPNGRYVDILINPISNHNGPSGYIVLLADITEKKRLYQENLERARLTVMFEMAGTITHEFRQPLTVIQGLAELAERKINFLEGAVNVASIAGYLNRIKEECNRLNELTIRVANITQYQTRDINKGRIVELPSVEGIN